MISLHFLWTAIRGTAMLLASGLFATSQAATGCDLFTVSFALQPAGEKHFLHPDDVRSTFTLPIEWRANAGNVGLILDVRRVDASTLRVALAKKTATAQSVFLANLLMDEVEPKAFRDLVPDPFSGDTWLIEMTPACKPG